MKSIPLLIWSTCLFGLLSPAVAAEVPTNSIPALVAETLAHNSELRYYEAEIIAAKAGRKTAGLLAAPELNAEIGRKSSRDNAGLRGEGVAWSVSVMQTFEWPGRMGLRKAIANYDVQLAELGLSQFRADLANRVRTTAWSLWAARQKLNATRAVQQRFSELRAVLVQRDPAGITPTLELRVIEATELTLRKRVTDAEVNVQAARSELNWLRGKPTDDEVFIETAEIGLQMAQPLADLIALARTNNFEIRLKAAELAQQGFKIDLARNERYPAVSVGPFISEENALERDRIAGIGLSVPLPLWRKNAANVEVAEARRQQAGTLLSVSIREVERALTRHRQAYETRLTELNQWRANSLEEFSQAAALADRHYRLGAVPVTTYVELQKQYVEAVDALLDLKAEVIQAAGELERVTGAELRLITLQPDVHVKP